jgi:signal transduction histidine kinase
MNILSNAIDAIEIAIEHGQQITPTISIHTGLIDESRAQIRIRDNGNGIPEAIKQQIFDPFFTTKPVGSGTGMGLAISYQIITDRHHGTLSCSSHSGEGTEFVIQIPLQQNLRDEELSRE